MINLRRSGLSRGFLVMYAVVTLLAGASGLVLSALRYFVVPQDPFAAVPTAFPFWQHAHLLVVPALTLCLGYLWARHGQPHWESRKPRRKSGLALAGTGLVMVFSGTLFQAATTPSLRQAWSLLHTVSGVAWLLLLAAHLLVRGRANGLERINGQSDACPPAPKAGSPEGPPRWRRGR